MKLPSKITTYHESVISKFPPILSVLKGTDTKIADLYIATIKYFSGIEEYLDTLDCLFALKRIRYDAERGVLCYVA